MQEKNFNGSGASIYWGIATVVTILFIGLAWYFFSDREEVATEVNTEQFLVIPEEKTDSLDRFQPAELDDSERLAVDSDTEGLLENEADGLPELEQSDEDFTKDLLAVSPQIQPFLFADEQIKKYVFSINDMAQGFRPPLKRLREIAFTEPFLVTEEAGRIYMSPQAYHRYDQLALAIDSIDVQVAATVYKRYLPLLQSVFAEFSYPNNFTIGDSIKAATAKVLQAPVITAKIELIRPSVQYKFADPALENLSPLDKQMLRMGPENTRMIQTKLRQIIEAIIATEQE